MENPERIFRLPPGQLAARTLALPSSVVRTIRCRGIARVVDVYGFKVQKHGNTPSECEDAFAHTNTRQRPRATFSAAIADGATEAIFSRQWANLLVHHFMKGPRLRRPWDVTWLAAPGDELRSTVDIAALPWYAQEKAGRGAFATLLGVTFRLNEGTYWSRSVGDSCMAVVSQSGVPTIFPSHLASSAAFGSNPYLVGSNPAMNAHLAESQFAQDPSPIPLGQSEFLLMTDAIGSWFAAAVERGERPWHMLSEVRCQEDFSSFVSGLRESRMMRNDDVTLVRIAVECAAGES